MKIFSNVNKVLHKTIQKPLTMQFKFAILYGVKEIKR